MRKPLIAGNWKMNLTLESATALAQELKESIGDITEVALLVCPPFVYLESVGEALQGSHIKLGAQDMYFEEEGAFTGEVSGKMLKGLSCAHVILGHSERRHILGEDDELIKRKVHAALREGLRPLLCVGELLAQRENGSTEKVLKAQVEKGLAELSAEELARLVIAYEPVWAIGTGRTATPEQAQQAHAFIRGLVAGLYDEKCAREMMILYGGSVKPENTGKLVRQPDIDGALVGGASLKAKVFADIVTSTREVYAEARQAS